MTVEAVTNRSWTGPRTRLRSRPRCGASRRRSREPGGQRGIGGPDRLGDPGQRGLRLRTGRDEADLLTGPGRGGIGELPGAPELGRDRGVDGGERARVAGAGIAAAGRLRQLLERDGREARALDRDRIDGDAGLAGGGDRGVERGLARPRRLAVREQDQNAARTRLLGQRVRRLDDGVVERGALAAVDRDRAQCLVDLQLRGREAGQLDGAAADRDDGHAIVAGLQRDEPARGGLGIREGLPPHRLRAVDDQRDALGAAQVGRLEPGDGNAVLGQRGRVLGRLRSDDEHADHRVRARVDPAEAGGGSPGCEQGRQHRRRDEREEDAPHEWLP
jgi:hypothetical protein